MKKQTALAAFLLLAAKATAFIMYVSDEMPLSGYINVVGNTGVDVTTAGYVHQSNHDLTGSPDDEETASNQSISFFIHDYDDALNPYLVSKGIVDIGGNQTAPFTFWPGFIGPNSVLFIDKNFDWWWFANTQTLGSQSPIKFTFTKQSSSEQFELDGFKFCTGFGVGLGFWLTIFLCAFMHNRAQDSLDV